MNGWKKEWTSGVVAAHIILVMMVMVMTTSPEHLPCTWCCTNKSQSILTTLLESERHFSICFTDEEVEMLGSGYWLRAFLTKLLNVSGLECLYL